MRKIFKISSVLLIVVLIVTSFSGCGTNDDIQLSPEEKAIANSAFIKPSQNEDFKYKIYEDYISISSYIGNAIEVNIPEKIDKKPVYVIEEEAFYNNKNIVSVVMGKNIWQIGRNAFGDCDNLKSITLSENLKEIPETMCRGCSSLFEIKFPDMLVKIGNSSFSNCEALQEIIIPGRVETISDYAFSGCRGVSTLLILDGELINDDGTTQPYNKTIGVGAFTSLVSCEKIIIGKNVTKLDSDAFSYSGTELEQETMFYGYVPSPICDYCAENKLKFTEIVDGDEIDKSIKQIIDGSADSIVDFKLNTSDSVSLFSINYNTSSYSSSIETYDSLELTTSISSFYSTKEASKGLYCIYDNELNKFYASYNNINKSSTPKLDFSNNSNILIALPSQSGLIKSCSIKYIDYQNTLYVILNFDKENIDDKAKGSYSIISFNNEELLNKKINEISFIIDAPEKTN